MAKRISLTHEPDVRSRIQASQIINRLTKHINGELQLEATQVNAAKILLSKSVPDLSSIELKGNPDQPLVHTLAPSDSDLIQRYLKQKETK